MSTLRNPTIDLFYHFIGESQQQAILECLKGEERDWFHEKIKEYSKRIETMPKTYEQDGKGDAAIAYLHYFTPSADWWITERDCEEEQQQAFGLADLGYGAELGYISIVE